MSSPKTPRVETRIVDARFIAAVAPGAGPLGAASELPPPTCGEIAFAGRSNVGKSSLINALVERKNLVRTSSTPGSTRQINVYETRAQDATVLHLVDLPGYGFTKRSKAETRSWRALIEGYLRSRVTLAAVVILVDARRGLEEEEHELARFVEEAREVSRRPVEVVIVATKLDKIPLAGRKVALDAVRKDAKRRVIGFSSETREGREELWAALRRAALGEASPAPAS